MEEVLDGLYRWFGKSLSLDWIDESPKILQLRELLKKCQNRCIILQNFLKNKTILLELHYILH